MLGSYRANVIGPFLLTGALAPAMARRWRGAVVNIGSNTGLIGSDTSARYSSTKAAAPYQIRGPRTTGLGGGGHRRPPPPNPPTKGPGIPQSRAAGAPPLPSRRMSTPEEVAAAVVFLAGDDAANIHGAVLSVDGGWAAT
ncbi:MAG: SDR family oxidoreductase [Mycobacterium sp.]|nr:SDR family oxidoreductase [Mycobacterium sp.]